MEEKEIDGALGELLRDGHIEHKGVEDGDDTFGLTEEGLEAAEKLIAKDPEITLFFLSIARNDPKLFYHMIKQVARIKDAEED